MRSIRLAAIMLAALGAPFALAQSQPPALPLVPPPSNLQCPRGVPIGPGQTTGSATLSEQLARSKGVICPPAGVDPGIAAPPAGGGVTPVIPPPDTPGGDPGLIPR
jgi:hypothetical protein